MKNTSVSRVKDIALEIRWNKRRIRMTTRKVKDSRDEEEVWAVSSATVEYMGVTTSLETSRRIFWIINTVDTGQERDTKL